MVLKISVLLLLSTTTWLALEGTLRWAAPVAPATAAVPCADGVALVTATPCSNAETVLARASALVCLAVYVNRFFPAP